MKTQLLRYWLAMNATAFDSAVHASKVFCGMAGLHQATTTAPALNLQQFAAYFLVTFGLAILNYLDTHPLTTLLPATALSGGQGCAATLLSAKPAP